jgi:hypothetical protein
VRRLRPETGIAWWFIGAGVFLNGCGVTVDMASYRLFGVTTGPNVADAFWSALFPAATVVLVILVRRAAAREEPGAAVRNTVICVPIIFFTSIYAWPFVAWRSYHAESISPALRRSWSAPIPSVTWCSRRSSCACCSASDPGTSR